MGYIEILENGNEIEIFDNGLKITEDALLLANFLKNFFKNNKKLKKGLEIGAGQGIISLLLSDIEHISIDAVEIQKDIYSILKNNIKKNNLENKIFPINEDVKNIKNEYDFIFSNPPYRKLNSGKLPKNEMEKISKYEVLLTLNELFLEIKRLLKNYGEFFLIIPNTRLNDVFSYIYQNKLNILTLKTVHLKQHQLILLHGKKGGNKNSKIDILE